MQSPNQMEIGLRANWLAHHTLDHCVALIPCYVEYYVYYKNEKQQKLPGGKEGEGGRLHIFYCYNCELKDWLGIYFTKLCKVNQSKNSERNKWGKANNGNFYLSQ